MRPNPFTPGSIIAEEYFVGRHSQLEEVDRLTNQLDSGFSVCPIAFLAPAGFGKTTLLKHVISRLRRQSWLCGYAEASSDTATAIQDLLTDIRRSAPNPRTLRRALRRVSSFNATAGIVGFGLGLKDDASHDNAYTRLTELLESLVEMAEHDGVGLALLIDEAQVLTSGDIFLIIRAVKTLLGHRIALIFSGLPNLVSILERSSFSTPWVVCSYLNALTGAESKSVLTDLLSIVDGRFDRASRRQLIDFCDGHPLVLQIAGSNAWILAQQDPGSGETRITVKSRHAKLAIAKTKAQLAQSYYLPIWSNCTGPERTMLTWIATSANSSIPFNALRERAQRLEEGGLQTFFELQGRGIIHIYRSSESDYSDTAPVRLILPGFDDFVRNFSASGGIIV